MRKIDQVKKRDGRVVPYDEAKIASAIFKAARAVGGEDHYMATELARVVTMFLERYYPKDVPEIEDIHDMVEKVLIETGHARTAKAYILYRVNKSRKRGEDPAEHETPTLVVMDPANRETIQPWDRERLRVSLERDGACPALLSSEVARVVEARLLASGLRRVTPRLVREFAANLLFDRGLLASPHESGKEPVDGLVESIFRPAGAGRTPASVARELGERWLSRNAIEQMYLPDVLAAQREGKIRISPFEEPLRVDTLPVPSEMDALAAVPWLRDHVAGGLILTPPATIEAAAKVREALSVARADRHVVRLPAGTSVDVAAAFSEALASEGLAAIDLTMDAADLSDEARIDALVRMPGLRMMFDRALPLPAAAPCITILLGWMGTLAARDGVQKFFLFLDPLIDLVVSAHLDRRKLLRRLSAGPGLPLSGLCVPGRTSLAEPFPEGIAYPVSFHGLEEAVRRIDGSGMEDGEKPLLLGLRIVSWLQFRLREESIKHGIRLVLAAPDRTSNAPSVTDPRLRARVEGRLHPLLAGACLSIAQPPQSARALLAYLHEETSTAGVEWTVGA